MKEDFMFRDCSLGENIKNLRIAKKQSQEDFALELGVTRQALSNYEQGKNVPSIDLVTQIAVKNKVSIDKLVGLSMVATAKVSALQKTVQEHAKEIDSKLEQEIIDFIIFKLKRVVLMFI